MFTWCLGGADDIVGSFRARVVDRVKYRIICGVLDRIRLARGAAKELDDMGVA